MMTDRLRLALILLAAAGLARTAQALEPAHLVADFPRGQIVLETRGPRCLALDIYVASTPEQRAQGLMFVEALGEFEGMYFGYPEPMGLVMWMKNTILPLDMLFIREDLHIARIEAKTTPFSTERIESGEPVIGVLEVNGGFAGRWGVTAGTRVLGAGLEARPTQ